MKAPSFKTDNEIGWKIAFSAACRDFDDRFRHVLDNIRRHQHLIDTEAQAQEIEEAHRTRQIMENKLEEFIREKNSHRKTLCAEWLSPADIETPKLRALKSRTKGTNEWLLKLPEMITWKQGSHHLWLTGKPGAGNLRSCFLFLMLIVV
jgi:hypothetical protein